MGRPIYPYELGDPDFAWLISNFQESHPEYCFIESDCLPLVFIENHVNRSGREEIPLLPAGPAPREVEERDKE